MGESWEVLYAQADQQESVISELKRLMAAKGYRFEPAWSSRRPPPYPFLPPWFHCWVSPSRGGWISISKEFADLVVTNREICAALDCLGFECWIHDENWGYVLYEGHAIRDVFDSDSERTLLLKGEYPEWWEFLRSYTAPHEPTALSLEELGELCSGHPEQLLRLPRKHDASPELLREILSSRMLFQVDIVRRLAEYIDLPNFDPLLSATTVGQSLWYRSLPTQQRGPDFAHIADALTDLEAFFPLAFHPLSIDQYRDNAKSVPCSIVRGWISSAIGCYRWYLSAFPASTAEWQAIAEETIHLRVLWEEIC